MAAVDSYTKLLLHCDGADESTTFTDSSLTPKTQTAVNQAQIDTAQSVFGGAAMLLDGTGDYVTSPDHADWNFADGDFTIDLRVRFTATALTDSYQMLVTQAVDANNRWFLYWNTDTGINFYAATTGGGTLVNFGQGSDDWSADTWYHVALVRYGNEWDIYRNGTSVASATDASTMPDLAALLSIGVNIYEADYYFDGWMDEIRVSKGIARWTGNFTPPTVAYGTVAAAGGSPMIFSGGVVVG